MKCVTDGLQNCGLGGVTFAYETKNVSGWHIPIKRFHSAEVLDHDLSDFHQPASF
jgi:hypothetical protein